MSHQLYAFIAVGCFIALVAGLRLHLLSRRAAWLALAKEELGAGFSTFARADDLPFHSVSEGREDGSPARFAADDTGRLARLEVALPEGVDKAAVQDFFLEEKNSLETETEGVIAGYDIETERLVLKARAHEDARATVRALREEAASLRKNLASLLEKRGEKAKTDERTFGELTGPDGRHAFLGIGLGLSPDEWERSDVGKVAVGWDRIPPAGSPPFPCILRVAGTTQAPELSKPEARERLLEQVALGFIESAPDGCFEGDAPSPRAEAGEPIAGFDTHRTSVDFLCEVPLSLESVERRPYRYLVHAIFAPWSVVLVSLQAPRDEADALLDRILAAASLEPPAES